jgi:hypothetical protein
MATPATTDYWVNDAASDPLFVVTAEANAGLVKMLPEILTEVRTVVGERPRGLQPTPLPTAHCGGLRPAHLPQR